MPLHPAFEPGEVARLLACEAHERASKAVKIGVAT